MNERVAPRVRRAHALLRAGAAILSAALVFSLWASPDRAASLAPFCVNMAGLVLVLVFSGRRAPHFISKVTAGQLEWLFLAIGFASLCVTLFATRWPSYKLSWLSDVYAALPSVRSLSWWGIKDGLHPNQAGAFLALGTAFASAVASTPSVSACRKWPAAFLTVAGLAVVYITGSRAALAGLVVALLAVLVVRTRRWLWMWVTGASALVLGLLASGWLARIVHFFLQDETLDTKVVARLDIWTSAVAAIQDHAFTGIGLGVFNQVMPMRYPYHTVGLSYDVSQAHNLFLDTALAVGIPGLIGFLLMLAGIVLLLASANRDNHGIQVVCLGVLASLLVYLVFGLTDSIGLSVPTSFIIWLWAGALAIMNPVATQSEYHVASPLLSRS